MTVGDNKLVGVKIRICGADNVGTVFFVDQRHIDAVANVLGVGKMVSHRLEGVVSVNNVGLMEEAYCDLALLRSRSSDSGSDIANGLGKLFDLGRGGKIASPSVHYRAVSHFVTAAMASEQPVEAHFSARRQCHKRVCRAETLFSEAVGVSCGIPTVRGLGEPERTVEKISVGAEPEGHMRHVAVVVELSYVETLVGVCGIVLLEGHHIGAYGLVGIFL